MRIETRVASDAAENPAVCLTKLNKDEIQTVFCWHNLHIELLLKSKEAMISLIKT